MFSSQPESSAEQAAQDRLPGRVLFIMEPVEGTLDHFATKRYHVTEDVLRSIAWQVLKGLEQLRNQGAAHRDLRLENIFFTTGGNIKVFVRNLNTLPELSIRTTDDATNHSTTFSGAIRSMAPERLTADLPGGEDGLEAECAADTWSLALCLSRLTTKKIAFESIMLPEEIAISTPPVFPKDFSFDSHQFLGECYHKKDGPRKGAARLLRHRWFRTCTPETCRDAVKQWLDRHYVPQEWFDDEQNFAENQTGILAVRNTVDPRPPGQPQYNGMPASNAGAQAYNMHAKSNAPASGLHPGYGVGSQGGGGHGWQVAGGHLSDLANNRIEERMAKAERQMRHCYIQFRHWDSVWVVDWLKEWLEMQRMVHSEDTWKHSVDAGYVLDYVGNSGMGIRYWARDETHKVRFGRNERAMQARAQHNAAYAGTGHSVLVGNGKDEKMRFLGKGGCWVPQRFLETFGTRRIPSRGVETLGRSRDLVGGCRSHLWG